MTALTHSTLDVPAYATDSADNPAREPVQLAVFPPSLGSVRGDKIVTAGHTGSGVVTVRAGRALSVVPFEVVDKLSTLSATPTQVDLGNGQTQKLTISGTARGKPAALPDSAVSWTVSPPALGTVAADGTFTAAASGGGLATVTARAGTQTATVSVAGRTDLGPGRPAHRCLEMVGQRRVHERLSPARTQPWWHVHIGWFAFV
ncbi:Ig-like domain-containing protein [Fodinicola feengrottensis]|uniref:Ig-like domain-containing protein n=1 Tax=Fodinicola feengrottensis TaxID=435914 RepID=UPI002441C4DA|nr:Ig-like domain-containing protein [Fodinicola feengrottensis]